MTTTLTRIASEGQVNPIPLPETADLTPEQRAEYTFVLEHKGEAYLVTEKQALELTPLAKHMSVGNVWTPLP